MRAVRFRRLVVFGAAVALAAPVAAQANEVTKWNAIAVNTVLAPTQPGFTSGAPAAAQLIAMVQGAVYGAVNATDRHGQPYLVRRSFPKASPDAAAAAAAFGVLDALFPAQHTTFQMQYDTSLAGLPSGPAKESGVEVGMMAADAMLAQGHDGRQLLPCVFGAGPGAWQPLPGLTAGTFLCDPTPWVANATPFLVQSSSQFRTAGPYPLTSPQYAADLNEIKQLGSLTSTTRTPEQTHIAVFWQSNPAGNFNALARRFVDAQGLDVSQSALLFAMVDLTAADAIMNAWNEKYHWSFWRPMAAIRGADTDGNPATVADHNWKPLFDPSLDASIGGVGPPLVTPPYPDQPSGLTAYTSSTMHAFQSFFGTDEMTFYLTSSRFPGERLSFTHFSTAINQVVEARIWAGIHFRRADVAAANLGLEVERYTHTHQFAFVH